MNKLCLITGGGSGIGRATAIKFAENKIDTIIVGRREDALAETKNLANDNSKYINFIKADISNEVGINNLYNEINKNLIIM
jgi:Short-chain dehydrogenases of various substrate specificities